MVIYFIIEAARPYADDNATRDVNRDIMGRLDCSLDYEVGQMDF